VSTRDMWQGLRAEDVVSRVMHALSPQPNPRRLRMFAAPKRPLRRGLRSAVR